MARVPTLQGLDSVVIVDNTARRPATFLHSTAGSTSLNAGVTSSAGSGNSQTWQVDATTQCQYGVVLGLFYGFQQPQTSSNLFFGILNLTDFILINGGLNNVTISAGGGGIGLTTTNVVTASNMVVSDLTSGRVTFAGASGRLVDDADMTFATDTLTVTKVLVKAGSSSSTGKVGGVLKTDTTAVGNVGAGEDDLITYSVPASTLGTNGDYITFDMAGTFAANANTKRVRIKFGATTLFDTTALIFNGVDWRAEGKIIRTGATTQKAICTFSSATTLLTQIADYTTPGETLSGAITLKATGEATSNNDIVQEFLVVETYLGA